MLAGTVPVIYLVGQLRSGGSERQLYYLLRHIDRDHYTPTLVVWNLSETDTYLHRIRELHIPIHAFPRADSAAAKVMRLRRLVRMLRPAIVHSFSFYLNFAAQWSVLGTTTTAIGTMRSVLEVDKKITGFWLGNLSARWPRNQIYNSYEAAQRATASHSPFIPRRVFVVRNGVDLDCFRPIRGPVPKSPGILGVGSLVPVKRWDRLLRAACELKRRQLEFVVEIVGDGPLLDHLRAEIQRLGLSDRVMLAGHVEQVRDRFADADFLVHSSDTEGCPNAIMEAMACGRAVVTTDAGDAATLVEDGRTGFVVHRENEAMLVERIVTLMTNPTLCVQMGIAARAKAEREFSLTSMIANTLTVYRAAAKVSQPNSRIPAALAGSRGEHMTRYSGATRRE